MKTFATRARTNIGVRPPAAESRAYPGEAKARLSAPGLCAYEPTPLDQQQNPQREVDPHRKQHQCAGKPG
jgi:hypothetical protein